MTSTAPVGSGSPERWAAFPNHTSRSTSLKSEAEIISTIASSGAKALRPTSDSPRWKALDTIQWLLTVATVGVALFLPLTGSMAPGSVLPFTLPFVLLHGLRRYGWRRFLTFFVVTVIVSLFLENLSVETGFPFGAYHYNGGPLIFHVPLMVPPIYFSLGYLSWLCASVVLDRADENLDKRGRTGRVNLAALPMLAAAAITMYDVAADAQASTVEQLWTWHDGGGMFGVPYTNYVGWWFTTYVYFQIFALILGRAQGAAVPGSRIVNRSSLIQPVLIYAALGLSFVSYFVKADVGTVIDNTGAAWNTGALNETAMIVGLFSVVVLACVAFAKIIRGDTASPR